MKDREMYTEKTSVKLSPQMLEDVKRKSSLLGLTVSSYLRTLVVKDLYIKKRELL